MIQKRISVSAAKVSSSHSPKMLELMVMVEALRPNYVYLLSDHVYRVIFSGKLDQSSIPDANAFTLSLGDSSEKAQSVEMHTDSIDLRFSSDPVGTSMVSYNTEDTTKLLKNNYETVASFSVPWNLKYVCDNCSTDKTEDEIENELFDLIN